MSYHRYPVGLAVASLVLLVVFATYAPAQVAQPVSLPNTTWLNISTFSFHQDTSLNNRDSFVLKGSFNAEPYSLESTGAVTLTIGGKAITYTHDLWRRVGRNACKARTGGVSAQITYWIGGSSRCNFTFIGSRQDMPSYMVSPYETTIQLQIGATFDESVTVMVTVQNPRRGTASRAKLDSYSDGRTAMFALDTVCITRSRKAGHDRMTISGRCWNAGFDPEKSALGISFGALGALHANFSPAGIVTVVNGKGRCTLPLSTGGRVTMSFDLNTGKMAFVFTGIDLSTMQNPDLLIVAIVNEDSAPIWGWKLWFKENRSHTSFRY